MRFFLLLTPTIILVLYGQLMTKWRISSLLNSESLGNGLFERMICYLLDPFIVSGYVAAFLGSLTWIIVIEKYPLSYAFPVYNGLMFASVVIASTIILDEQVSAARVASITLILAGILIGSTA